MNAGAVEVLVVAGANPVYAAPADLGFAEALQKVPLRIHHGLSLDETAVLCQWHLPAAHPLETWSDVRAACGTVSIVQPLIAPLYGGLSVHELVAAFIEDSEARGYEILKAHWAEVLGDDEEFEARWSRALHDGVVAGTALPGEDGGGDARRVGRVPSRRSRRRGSRSPSAPTPACTTGASPTWAGSRSSPVRSRSSPGTTPRS